MNKKKLTTTRGPKLFGRLRPSEQDRRCTYWQGNGKAAIVKKVGRSWEFSVITYGFQHSSGPAYTSAKTAQVGLERFLAERGETSVDLGWEPK
ncbi:MAG TPA: hypothetical protein VFZ21_31685 [Gemmatimonadaceae bacterium]|nr:hypothetical protein [Gemmatimonadaceae bacterium]